MGAWVGVCVWEIPLHSLNHSLYVCIIEGVWVWVWLPWLGDWKEKILSEFDYVSCWSLLWCLPFYITLFLPFILFSPSSIKQGLSPCSPESWQSGVCQKLNNRLCWPQDNPERDTHTVAYTVRVSFGKVERGEEMREKWGLLKEHMAHDRKVTVTLKKLLRNEGLKHLMLV